jgi:hypothetical protein
MFIVKVCGSSLRSQQCQNCPGIYLGQTGQSFKIRYREHVQDIKNNKSRTGFLHHILNTGHAYDSIENTLAILNFQEKDTYLNTLERFHIYKAKKMGGLLNDNYTDTYNPVFELIC